jgi:hypothetical protein
MAGPITTGSHPKALWPGIHEWFGRTYDEHEVEYTHLFDTDSSSEKAYEEDVEATGFGLAPVKPEGRAVSYDTESQGYTKRYTHVAYSSGYIVTYEEMKDNLYEKVSKRRSGALAFSFRQTKENVGANVWNRGFNSSYLGGDGVELFSNAHPTVNGTQSNILAVASDLNEASIEDMVIQIMDSRNSRGLRFSNMPRCLIVPRSLWFEANRVLKSTLQNDTANNALNVLKSTNTFPEGIKMNHYLSDQDAWFIRTNCKNGMTVFDRDIQPFMQDNDFDTSNLKAKKYERYVFGWTDWRQAFATPGA